MFIHFDIRWTPKSKSNQINKRKQSINPKNSINRNWAQEYSLSPPKLILSSRISNNTLISRSTTSLSTRKRRQSSIRSDKRTFLILNSLLVKLYNNKSQTNLSNSSAEKSDSDSDFSCFFTCRGKIVEDVCKLQGAITDGTSSRRKDRMMLAVCVRRSSWTIGLLLRRISSHHLWSWVSR